jgi:hypothetical protein
MVSFLRCGFHGIVSTMADNPKETELFASLLVTEVTQPNRFLARFRHEPSRL